MSQIAYIRSSHPQSDHHPVAADVAFASVVDATVDPWRIAYKTYFITERRSARSHPQHGAYRLNTRVRRNE
jgi:hypothetical protein